MVEIEKIEKPEELSVVSTEATSTKHETSSSSELEHSESGEECTQHKETLSDKVNPAELEKGDIFYGTAAHQGTNNKKVKSQGVFIVLSVNKVEKNKSKEFTLMDVCGNTFKSNQGGVHITKIEKEQKKKQIEQKVIEAFGSKEDREKYIDYKEEQNKKKEEELKEEKKLKSIEFNFSSLKPEEKLNVLIKSGIKNIWMVGPAGCGKSTMARNVAKELDIPYLCISCGIGTSATEFTGYKYPEREATKFSEYYAKKSIILIDEMTALDPAVAQVLNAALANDEIETTTGLVHRNPECAIIATSNTFGNGADRQYVANNQLDSSTIDRFVGSIIEVDYSKEYESQFNSEVVRYVNYLRACIKCNSLRRVASTRMIQAADKMRKIGIKDWKDLLIISWTDSEKAIVKDFMDKAYRKDTLRTKEDQLKELHEFLYGRIKSAA